MPTGMSLPSYKCNPLCFPVRNTSYQRQQLLGVVCVFVLAGLFWQEVTFWHHRMSLRKKISQHLHALIQLIVSSVDYHRLPRTWNLKGIIT